MARLTLRDARRVLHDGRRRYEVDIPEFVLASGDRRAIVGRSGTGKTTVMDMLALANPPDAAAYFELEDGQGATWRDPWRLGPAAMGRLRAGNFGYVLQTSPLFPFLTCRENARLSQELADRVDAPYLDELLAALELDGLPAATRVADLSVGQRQRLAIVRALAHRPAFLLADEPTAALDPQTADSLMALFMRVAAERGTAVLVITHDSRLARMHGCTIHQMQPRGDGVTGAVLGAAGEAE